MTNAVAIFSPLDRVTDEDGNPVSGAKINVYEAGTSSTIDIFSDQDLTVALPNPVICNAAGQPTSDGSATCIVYVDTTSYKLVVTDANDVLIPGMSYDAIRGADDIPNAATVALPRTPSVNKTSSYTIVTGDRGKLINASGSSTAITLPDAGSEDIGDGWEITVRHNDSTAGRTVTVRTTGGQTIGMPGQSTATSVGLTGLGHTLRFVSDGANWNVIAVAPPFMQGGHVYIKVSDRLTAPPASPTPGSRYICNGTATGAWATLSVAEHDIVESDGNGSWLKYTPGNGWMAWVDDEDVLSIYHDSAWVDKTGIDAPDESALQVLVVEHQVSDGSSGGNTQASGAGWVARTLNTTVSNTISGASADGATTVTLPAGNYLVAGWGQFVGVDHGQIRLKSTTTSKEVSSGAVVATSSGVASMLGTLVLTAEETLRFEDIATTNVVNGRGTASGASGGVEKYANVTIIKIDARQGPQGEQGPQGADGLDAAYPYQWSTLTTGDPGSGKIRGNNATIASITQIAISETASDGASLASVIESWDDSTSDNKGTLKWSKETATQNYAAFRITGAGTDQGTYWTFPVTYIGTGGTISNADDGAVVFIEKGDVGDPGTTVPDISGLTVLDTDQIVPTEDLGIFYDDSASAHKAFYIPVPNYSFTDPAFGGVGDDTTANDTAWSDFIDAGITDGKPLWVPAGIYRVTTAAKAVSVNSAKGFRLFGDGAASVIKRMNNLTSALLDLQGGAPRVEDIAFTYSNGSTAVDGNHSALRFTGCTGARSRGVHINGAWYVAHEFRNCTDGEASGCYITSAVNRALYAQATSGQSGIRFISNYIEGSSATYYGINISIATGISSVDNVIVGNVIKNVQFHGIGGYLNRTVVTGNTITNVTNAGGVGILAEEINTSRPDRSLITSNKVVSSAIGIELREAINSKVSGNLIYANHASGNVVGVYALGSIYSQITDNEIATTANSAIGILGGRTTRSATDYDASNVTVLGNRVTQSGTSTVGVQFDANSSLCHVDRAGNDIVGSAVPYAVSGSNHKLGLPQDGTYTVGDLFYASAAGTLSALAAGTSGYVVTSNGAGAAPSYQPGGGGGSLVIGTTAISGGSDGNILYRNGSVVGGLASTGSGNVVRATSPTLTTPTISGSYPLRLNSTDGTQPILIRIANVQTSAFGASSTIPLYVQNSGFHICWSVTDNASGGASNYVSFVAQATGNPAILRSEGVDTNVDLSITPKGSGVVRMGTHSALSGQTVTGYITIKDSGGTSRKLAVVS